MQELGVSVIPVILIEKHPLVSVQLQRLLVPASGARFVPENEINAERIAGCIFVVDSYGFSLPHRKICERLLRRYPQSRFILLAEFFAQSDVEQMMSMGIKGIVLYSDVFTRLPEAIRAISQGLPWISPYIFSQSRPLVSNGVNPQLPFPDTITRREQQILELAIQRLSNKEIADLLEIQECTVKFHLSNIFLKLQVSGRHELLSHWSNDLLKFGSSSIRDVRRKHTQVPL